MYQLTSPSLKKKMREVKIFVNRFQTKYDRRIFQLCSSLQKMSLVKHVFIDKNHLTTIIREKDEKDSPVIIYDFDYIPTLFHQDPAVLELLTKFRQTDPVEDDEEMADETLDQSSSTGRGRIIDVE